MTVAEYISTQDTARQSLLTAIHDAILKNDPSVEAKVGDMMSKTMILYTDRDFFKYGLASVKDYMSLHCLPIYMNPPLHNKYEALLPKAKIQKGCINFKNETEMPLDVVTQLLIDCAPIDLIAIRQKYLADKKKK
jgi:hypothetical protein